MHGPLHWLLLVLFLTAVNASPIVYAIGMGERASIGLVRREAPRPPNPEGDYTGQILPVPRDANDEYHFCLYKVTYQEARTAFTTGERPLSLQDEEYFKATEQTCHDITVDRWGHGPPTRIKQGQMYDPHYWQPYRDRIRDARHDAREKGQSVWDNSRLEFGRISPDSVLRSATSLGSSMASNMARQIHQTTSRPELILPALGRAVRQGEGAWMKGASKWMPRTAPMALKGV